MSGYSSKHAALDYRLKMVGEFAESFDLCFILRAFGRARWLLGRRILRRPSVRVDSNFTKVVARVDGDDGFDIDLIRYQAHFLQGPHRGQASAEIGPLVFRP